MKEKISVIVAVYNVRRYVGRCLESLLSQNCKNYEIIVVDDGSTDGSGEVIEEYYLKNPEKIRLVKQENAGLSAARNAGLAIARGEYVTFVDGDDHLEKSALTALYLEIKREWADIAVAGFFEDFSDFSKEVCFERGEVSFEGIMERMSREDGYKFVVVWGKLYRRDLFSGVEFPLGKIHEDQYIIHKLYYASRKTVTLDKKIYRHTRREGSLGLQSGFSRHTDDLDALFLRSQFLNEKGYRACLIYVARHMMSLLDFYLRESPSFSDNGAKCIYIKKLLRFVKKNFGRGSKIYKSCFPFCLRQYVKCRALSYIWG